MTSEPPDQSGDPQGSPWGAPPPPPPVPGDGQGSPWTTPPPAAPGYPPQPGQYGYQPYGSAPQSQFAGFWARFGAVLLDSFIVGIPSAAIGVGLFFALAKDGFCRGLDYEDTGRIVRCKTINGGQAGLFFLVIAVLAVLSLAYYVVMIGRTGQTFGKRAAHVRVVDATTGQAIGIPRALGRQLMAGISGAFCYLGYLWMLWDPQRQTWHDKVVTSVVVTA